MKVRLTANGEQASLTLTPENAGEQRILDYLVMTKPLHEARNTDDIHGEVAFRVRHKGHVSHNRIEQLELVRVAVEES